MIPRRKHSAVLRDFLSELHRLERFDAENQENFNKRKLTIHQLHLLTESLFFAAFRTYEAFLRDAFLLYCMGKAPNNSKRVKSYLSPKNFLHAEQLIQSSMPYLDWASPDVVIQRAELYLKNGEPIKLIYSSRLQSLRELKKIRNHIAHNSKESRNQYISVVKAHYSTIPLKIPHPGEFLLLTEKKNKKRYKLLTYFELMKKISVDLTS